MPGKATVLSLGSPSLESSLSESVSEVELDFSDSTDFSFCGWTTLPGVFSIGPIKLEKMSKK